MEPNQLGWEAYNQSFLNDLKEKGLNEIYMALFESMIEWLIPVIIEISEGCSAFLKVSAMQSYKLFTTFFMHFLSKQHQYNQTWFQQTFLFCLVWSWGSSLNSIS